MRRVLLKLFVSAETKMLVEKMKEEVASETDTFPYLNLARKGKFSWVDSLYLNSHTTELEVIRTKANIMRQVLGAKEEHKGFVTLKTKPWEANPPSVFTNSWTDPRTIMGSK